MKLEQEVAARGVNPRTASWKYSFFEQLVLAEGVDFSSAELTSFELGIVEPLLRFASEFQPFEYSQCYANSQFVHSLAGAEVLDYVEGYVLVERGHPVLHGWLALNGKIVDTTVIPNISDGILPPTPARILGVFAGREYLGIPFPRPYVLKRVGLDKGWSALIDDPDRIFPLLKNGLKWKKPPSRRG